MPGVLICINASRGIYEAYKNGVDIGEICVVDGKEGGGWGVGGDERECCHSRVFFGL